MKGAPFGDKKNSERKSHRAEKKSKGGRHSLVRFCILDKNGVTERGDPLQCLKWVLQTPNVRLKKQLRRKSDLQYFQTF